MTDTTQPAAQDNVDALFSRDTPAFAPSEWDNGSWSIQQWLERTAWRTLKNTRYGRPPVETGVIPELFSDPLLRQVYLIDVAVFIGGEKTSYEAVAGLLRCAPDEASQIYLGTQVMDECRHYEVFCRRMADLGVAPAKRETLVKRYTTPAVRNFYDLILEQVDKRDFIAGSLAQNIVMEGMAYPLYRYEIKYWSRIDPSLSQIIRGAFADEAHHVGFGEAMIRGHLKGLDADRRGQLRALLAQFSGLMTEAFEQVINHYIGLYQECANQYMAVMGDIEIFPGRKMASVTEEDQVRLLLQEIRQEHAARAARIGIA
ncbi:MAG: long-chain fatty aldehyde decarbonylase [Pseudomonadota bacterium]